MKLSLYSGMGNNGLPTFLCFFLQLLLWSFVFVPSCLICFCWLMFLRSSSFQIELGATKARFIIETSREFSRQVIYQQTTGRQNVGLCVDNPSHNIFMSTSRDIFTDSGGRDHILVFLIISLFGMHTFRKSWPLSDLSVFDIMWHPLMLLEIEKDNFWYWGAKLFLQQ